MLTPKDIIGVDVGLVRSGVARASNIARLAEPLTTVPTAKLVDFLSELAAGGKIEAIAVGLPRNLSSADTTQTAWVRQWVETAKARLTLPFFWQDEALTSSEAKRRLKVAKKDDIDAVAASVILQDYLDTPPEKRVVC